MNFDYVIVGSGLFRAAFRDEIYDNHRKVITREYSLKWRPSLEPYYTVNDAQNNNRYLSYKSLADQEEKVIFGGRLAEYKYSDMAPEKVITLFKS